MWYRFVMVLAAFACAGIVFAQGKQTAVKPESIYRRDGLTFVSPAQPGWTLFQSSASLQELRKQSANEVLSISVKAIAMTTPDDDEKLMREFEALKVAELSKLQRDSVHFNYGRFKGRACVQYDGVFTGDIAVPGFRYFNFSGYLCRHPEKPNAAVQVEFSSHSNVRGPSESEIEQRASFFEGLVFSKALGK